MRKVVGIANAVVELCCILMDAGEAAWDAADLAGRLQEWWWLVTHSALVDGPPVERARSKYYILNERQEKALEMTERLGRVTHAVMYGCLPLSYPEMIRLDLSGLVDLGLLEQDGIYYVQPDVRG